MTDVNCKESDKNKPFFISYFNNVVITWNDTLEDESSPGSAARCYIEAA